MARRASLCCTDQPRPQPGLDVSEESLKINKPHSRRELGRMLGLCPSLRQICLRSQAAGVSHLGHRC